MSAKERRELREKMEKKDSSSDEDTPDIKEDVQEFKELTPRQKTIQMLERQIEDNKELLSFYKKQLKLLKTQEEKPVKSKSTRVSWTKKEYPTKNIPEFAKCLKKIKKEKMEVISPDEFVSLFTSGKKVSLEDKETAFYPMMATFLTEVDDEHFKFKPSEKLLQKDRTEIDLMSFKAFVRKFLEMYS